MIYVQLVVVNWIIACCSKFREGTIQFNTPKTGVKHQNNENHRHFKHEVKKQLGSIELYYTPKYILTNHRIHRTKENLSKINI